MADLNEKCSMHLSRLNLGSEDWKPVSGLKVANNGHSLQITNDMSLGYDICIYLQHRGTDKNHWRGQVLRNSKLFGQEVGVECLSLLRSQRFGYIRLTGEDGFPDFYDIALGSVNALSFSSTTIAACVSPASYSSRQETPRHSSIFTCLQST